MDKTIAKSPNAGRDVPVSYKKGRTFDREQMAADQQIADTLINYFRGGDAFESTIQGWNPKVKSADADLNKYRPKMIARSRDIIRNDGYGQSILNTFCDNVIGRFFKLSPKINYRLLNRDFEWARQLSIDIKARWSAYAESYRYLPDINKQDDFRSLLKQCLNSYLVAGEALVLIRYRPGRYRLRLQLVEVDRLSTPPNLRNDKSVIDGVKLGRDGQPIGYYIRTSHESDEGRGEWRFIRRFDQRGRKQVIHVYDKERPDQRRGRGIFAPIIQAFKLLDNYSITEMERATAQAAFAAVITSSLPSHEAFTALGAAPSDEEGQTAIEQYMNCQLAMQEYGGIKINGAKVPHLTVGEKFELLKTDSPNTAYEQFVNEILRRLAAGSGASFEQVSKDFSKTTFASARTAMIEAFKRFLSIREDCPIKIANEVYALWLEEDLDFVSGYPDNTVIRFREYPEAWARASWIAGGKGEIDPLKQAQASEKNLANNRTTLEIECAELGLDVDEVLEQRQHEKEELRRRGLLPDQAAPEEIIEPELEDDNS